MKSTVWTMPLLRSLVVALVSFYKHVAPTALLRLRVSRLKRFCK